MSKFLTNSEQLLDDKISDVLLTNKENGRIGLTAGVDLEKGAEKVSIYQINMTPVQFKTALDKGAMVHVKRGFLEVELIESSVVKASPVESVVESEEKDENPVGDGTTFGEGSNNKPPVLDTEGDDNPIASPEPEDVKPAPKPAAKPVAKPTAPKK